jgi:hypothetical protein
MIEEVLLHDALYALIIRRDFHQAGARFFTPNDFSQQLGYLSHPKGHRIEPHIHKEVMREVVRTQEVLVIRNGRIRVDFYNDECEYLDCRTLETGDVILLVQGGHGFEILESCDMIEIKQGPYLGDEDKVRFTPRGATGGQPV